MGYDIHITRQEFWFDDANSRDISIKEWLELIEQDSEMRLDNTAEATLDNGQVLQIENEGLAVWTAYSKHAENGNMAWFDYTNGNIVVKNPDSEILKKMWSIAERLSAKVQGDECEIYDANGNIAE